ncbi:hypothetical protein [Pseudomonas sp. 37 R 15]|nr:hypothetical protein [Pseudomonas sp. 37 R 15]
MWGGGLLPIAVVQLEMLRLKNCYREQAPSHIWLYCIPAERNPAKISRSSMLTQRL